MAYLRAENLVVESESLTVGVSGCFCVKVRFDVFLDFAVSYKKESSTELLNAPSTRAALLLYECNRNEL